MNHADYQEQVSLYLDGMLGDRASAGLFSHLADCEECRSLLKLSMSVREHVAEQDIANVPSSLDQRVLGSNLFGGTTTRQSPWYAPVWFTRISVPLPAAASIVFLIIVGSLLFSPLLSQGQVKEAEIPKPFVDKIPQELQKTLDYTR